MNKNKLVKKLDMATDKALKVAMKEGSPIPLSKKVTLVGFLRIEKNKDNLYDILNTTGTILFNNISVFDIAVIIAQRYNKTDFKTIEKIIILEERFSKFHLDMIHYLHCMKSAKRDNDLQRFAILEDKFHEAELYAKSIKEKITIFKRMK